MQTSHLIHETNGRRAWLASLLLKQSDRFMPNLIVGLARLRALPCGYRRRLQRKAALTAAGAALVLAMAGSPLLVPSAHAATITVNETTSTLIDAITAANDDTATNGCAAGSGDDTIDLQADVLLTASFDYYYISETGLPLVTSTIIIEGNDHTIERDGAAPVFRILAVGDTGNLTLNDVTISGGSSTLNGGGVLNNEGILAINNSTLSGNNSYNDGAGLFDQYGTVTITDSVFTNNEAGHDGGGLYKNGEYSAMTITNTRFETNTAGDHGGAIYLDDGTMTITDSISLSDDGETLYLTTKGTFNVDSAVGGHSMVYAYDMTTEEFSGPVFDAPANGLPKTVDELQVE